LTYKINYESILKGVFVAKKREEQTPEDFINQIRDACAALNWQIAMDDSKNLITGLIIGEEEHVTGILEQLVEGDEYSIYTAGEVDKGLQ
jgi:hypothetical protein